MKDKTIITNKEYLAKIEENAGEALNAQGTKFLYGAPMLILVSANADNNVAHSNAASLSFSSTPTKFKLRLQLVLTFVIISLKKGINGERIQCYGPFRICKGH